MPYNFIHSLKILNPTTGQDRHEENVKKKKEKKIYASQNRTVVEQETMGWRSTRSRWCQRYASKLNIAGDGDVDAAENGYGAPVHDVHIYVNKIFDVNEKTLDTLWTSPMLMLILHWSWLRVVFDCSLNPEAASSVVHWNPD